MVGNEDISGTGNEYKFSVRDDVCDVTHTHRGWIMNGYLWFRNLGQLLEAVTERNMTKLERVRPILLKHSHHLFTHPLHLRDRRETKESI